MREVFKNPKFKLDSLLALAERLRGRPCKCDTSQSPKSGCMNWVIFVTFDDGVDWVFRSPDIAMSHMMSEESACKMLVSEAATLKYLRAHTSVPVPEVYSYSGSKDNDIGIPYILQSKVVGRALADYAWTGISLQPSGYKSPWQLLPMSDEDRHKIMSQLGDIMGRLSEIRFENIGSLFEDDHGGYFIGECLSPSFIWQWRDSLEELDRGPFSEECQYLNSLVHALSCHAKELIMAPHSFFAPIPESFDYPTRDGYIAAGRRWRDFLAVGSKPEGSKNRLDFCIAAQFLGDMIPRLTSTADGSFTLSHPDLHLGNIFVDGDFNITGIIDWGSTTSGPITELLATPTLGSSLPPTESQVVAFRSSFELRAMKISPGDWEKADGIRHFSRLVRLLSKQDYVYFKNLYETVWKFQEDGLPDPVNYGRLFHERAQQESNKKLLTELREDDDLEEEIREREKATFRYAEENGSDSLAVARKLTLMAEMNPGFVADGRLWRWIEDAVGRPEY